MAVKEEFDINDSKASELSSHEKSDSNDQTEIIPAEEDAVEPLIILQDEFVSAEAQNESGKPDSDTFNEVEVPPIQDDGELELLLEENEAENSADPVDEQKDGESDLDELGDDDFLGLDDEEFDDALPKAPDPSQEEALESQENDKTEKRPEKDNEPAENQKDSNDDDKSSVKSAKKSKAKITIGTPSATQIIVGLTLILMVIAGGVFYMNPALLGFHKEAQSVPLVATAPTPPVQIIQKQVESPKPLSENERYLAKFEDAGILRDELLEKKEEIYRLKHHYQNGIADLEDQINRELQKKGITSDR